MDMIFAKSLNFPRKNEIIFVHMVPNRGYKYAYNQLPNLNDTFM